MAFHPDKVITPLTERKIMKTCPDQEIIQGERRNPVADQENVQKKKNA
jgi:hypothetical protein